MLRFEPWALFWAFEFDMILFCCYRLPLFTYSELILVAQLLPSFFKFSKRLLYVPKKLTFCTKIWFLLGLPLHIKSKPPIWSSFPFKLYNQMFTIFPCLGLARCPLQAPFWDGDPSLCLLSWKGFHWLRSARVKVCYQSWHQIHTIRRNYFCHCSLVSELLPMFWQRFLEF